MGKLVQFRCNNMYCASPWIFSDYISISSYRDRRSNDHRKLHHIIDDLFTVNKLIILFDQNKYF